ncbi:response regulator [Paenibacillus sp. WQ 127069]|uniref:Response regulator n=1 Tax=Paenibacillus baimaensis TaxID=2982185 RepID=A0ABT2UBG6_9BACL|nr:response regulator [Paenibacillus sp. WQ 127069]MCU6791968.1 response regulator [Paenibacillus sp. WQ 127069]
MYKVMLVDDDYPVLELLSEAIDWVRLDLQLTSVHENGISALEACAEDMPDIVITDIGMPKMNGLELIRELQQRKPDIRVAILSCHNEFRLAQQAMKLNVQDYLLKDTLDPADLEKLLLQFKDKLDQEQQQDQLHTHLLDLVDRSKELMREKFIRSTIQEPILDAAKWQMEANAFGLSFQGQICLPVMGFISNYRSVTQRFGSNDILRFAVNNVIQEVLDKESSRTIHVSYDAKESFMLYLYPPGLKVNPYEQTKRTIELIQGALRRSLKITMNYLIGSISTNHDELKLGLKGLLGSSAQRFYLGEGEIARQQDRGLVKAHVFSFYDKANEEFRDILIDKREAALLPTIQRWMNVFKEQSCPPEMVKDWVLKLLLDLKLKLQSLQHFRSTYSVDVMHKDILEIDTLTELESWLIDYFHSAISVTGEIMDHSKRLSVLNALQYVSMNLDKRISLEEVAEHLFLNSSYFSRLFKKETGETFIEYVTRMKMERAKELLDMTNEPMCKICELLGYDSQSYFIKIFKSYNGLTPVEYRKQKSFTSVKV